MKWEERMEVQKGNYAEKLVMEHYRSKRIVPYRPDADFAHVIDFLFFDRNGTTYALDVKAKAARTLYPDTGIDIAHYRRYRDLLQSPNMSVFVVFVDEYWKEAYGNDLNDLTVKRRIRHNGRIREYPYEQDGIIYFPLEAMDHLFYLTDADSEYLKSLSKRSYDFPTYSYQRSLLT